MNPKEIRWKQRAENFKKAFELLESAIQIQTPSDLEKEGTIQRFEFTFELSWNMLKDYLESKDILESFPRDVLKKAFQYNVITDGEVWIDMLDSRNLLSHAYNKEKATLAYAKITKAFYPALQQLIQWIDAQ